MGILERLRAPDWKHADPAVRLASLYALAPEDAAALRSLAREDAEARVRRAAVARLDDAEVLAEAAASDPDDQVRAEAVRGLSGLAVETDDPARATLLVQLLLHLERTKEAVAVARDNAHAAVRAAVVDLLEEPKALGAISRHARDGATRLRALARLSDPAELRNVAAKCKHTDAAVGALEQLDDREALTEVAEHARSKVAVRRARLRLRALDAPGDAPAGHPMLPETRVRTEALVARVDGLVVTTDPGEAEAALAAARLAWAELQAELVEIEPAVTARFEAACEAVREAIAERQQERAAERARAEAAAQEQVDRVAICRAIEGLSGAGAEERIAELKVAWDALDPMPSEYAASLTRRFQDACRVFGERERRRTLAEAAGARLATLADELEHLADGAQPVEETVARWRGLRRDAEVLLEHVAANPEAGERLTRAVETLETREQELQAHAAKQEEHHLKRLHQLCKHVEGLAEAETFTLKAGEKALKAIKAALSSRVDLASHRDRQAVRTRLERARTVLGPRVQELRDADEWQRWANLQVQEELCREMEALTEETALDVAARKMKALQARWKPVALTPRAQGAAMWRRFKAAQDAVYARTAAYFAEQREARAANLAKKTALCEQAEALADSTDWVKTAAALQKLQAEWKVIGAVPRGREQATWERFRTACDRFFRRRQEDLKGRKEEWAANLAKKTALCEQAEALAESTDWDAATAEIKRLQAAWKASGPVRRSKSEAIWKRFRAACDTHFARSRHRHQGTLQARVQAREAVIREIEALVPDGEAGDTPEGLYDIVKDARARWQQAPDLPRIVRQDLAARFHDAIGRLVSVWPAAFVGTDLDPKVTWRRMEQLIERVEDLVSSEAPVELSPAERLARQLRERLAVNTMKGASAGVVSEERRQRGIEQELRTAQTQWARLGPVPPEMAAKLHERFLKACRRAQGRRRHAS